MQVIRVQRNVMIVFLVIGALVCSASAHATSTSPTAKDPVIETAPPTDKEKDPIVAVLLGVGVTAAGVAIPAVFCRDEGVIDCGSSLLLGAGLFLLGPSAGHMYAGQGKKAMRRFGLRAGVLAGAGGFLMLGVARSLSGSSGGGSLFLGGLAGAAYAGLMAHHIKEGADLCIEHNESLAASRSLTIQPSLVSAVAKKRNRRVLPGLALQATF